MRLQDLIQGSSPTAKKLLSAATRALEEQDAENLSLDADGALLVGKLLGQCVSKGAVTPDSLAAAAALARLVHAAPRKKGPLAEALVTGPYARALCDLITAAAKGLSAGRLAPDDTMSSLENLLACVDHLRTLVFKQAATEGWGNNAQQAKGTVKARGRIIMAPYATPALLDVILLIKNCESEDLDEYMYASKTAAEILASFLRGASGDGALALAAAPAAADGAALDAVLSRCGDALLQLDVCEAIYRCIKAAEEAKGSGGKAPPALHISALYRPLKELVFQVQGGEKVNRPVTYRRVLLEFNRRAGKAALVASLAPATPEATVCGQSVSFAPGSYVDLCQTSIALSLIIEGDAAGGNPENGSQGGEAASQPAAAAAPEIDIIEIPYRILSGYTMSSNATAGTVTLALTLSELPEALDDRRFAATASAGGRPMVVLTLHTADVVQLKDKVPLVAAALEAAGIKLPAGEADLSQPGRIRKMSMAIAGRPLAARPAAAAPTAAAAPAAKGKAKGSVKTSVLEQAERARADSRLGKTTSSATGAADAAAAAPADANKRQWRSVKRDAAPPPSVAALAAAAAAAGSVKPAPSRQAQPSRPASDPIEDPSAESPVHKAPAARTALLGVGGAAAETPHGVGAVEAEDLEDWMSQLQQPRAPLLTLLAEESDSDDDGEFVGNEAYEKGAAAARGESPAAAAAVAVKPAAALRAAKPAAADPKAPYKNPVQKTAGKNAVEVQEEEEKAAGAARRRPAAAKTPAKQLKAVAAAGVTKRKAAKPAKQATKAAAAKAVAAPVERRQTRTRAAAAAKGAGGKKIHCVELEDSDGEDMPHAEDQGHEQEQGDGDGDGDGFGAGYGSDGGYGGGGDAMDMDYDDMILSQQQDGFTASQERAEAASAAETTAAAAAAAKKQPRANANAILGKHTPKGGAKKPRGGRMAALGGPGAAKKMSPLTEALAAAAPPARTPARLQTETPAVAAGKKKDAGSDPVKSKKKAAVPAAPAAEVAPAAALLQKRAAAQKASKKLVERSSDEKEAEGAAQEEAPAAEAEAPWAEMSEEEEEEDAGWGAEDEDEGEAVEEEEEEEEAPMRKQPSPRRPAPPQRKKAPAPAAPKPKAPEPKPKVPVAAPAAPPKATARVKKAAAPKPPAPRPLAALAAEKEVSDGESSEYSMHGSDTDSGAAAAAAQQLLPAIGGVGIGIGAAALRTGRGRAPAAAISSSSDEEEDEVNDAEEEEEEEEGGESAVQYALPPATARAVKQGKKQVKAVAQGVLDENINRGKAQQDAFIADLKAGAAARLQDARADAVGAVKEAEGAAKAKLNGLVQAIAANEAAAAAAIAAFSTEVTGIERERARLQAEAAAAEHEVERGVEEARKRGKRRLKEAFGAVKGEAERGKKRVKEIIAEAVQEGQRAVLDMLNGVFFGVKEGAKDMCG